MSQFKTCQAVQRPLDGDLRVTRETVPACTRQAIRPHRKLWKLSKQSLQTSYLLPKTWIRSGRGVVPIATKPIPPDISNGIQNCIDRLLLQSDSEYDARSFELDPRRCPVTLRSTEAHLYAVAYKQTSAARDCIAHDQTPGGLSRFESSSCSRPPPAAAAARGNLIL